MEHQMNWKTGFQRLALIVSLLLVGLGVFNTFKTACDENTLYRKYENMNPYKSSMWSAIDPATGIAFDTLVEMHKQTYWHRIRSGTFYTVVSSWKCNGLIVDDSSNDLVWFSEIKCFSGPPIHFIGNMVELSLRIAA